MVPAEETHPPPPSPLCGHAQHTGTEFQNPARNHEAAGDKHAHGQLFFAFKLVSAHGAKEEQSAKKAADVHARMHVRMRTHMRVYIHTAGFCCKDAVGPLQRQCQVHEDAALRIRRPFDQP